MHLTFRKLGVPMAVAIGLSAGSAYAGQEPYVATYGDDTSIPDFYISAKHKQFTHTIDEDFQEPEDFDFTRGITPSDEQCNVDFAATADNQNWHLPNRNAGTFNWRIQLPKKPQSNIDIAIQCGLLKPNTETFGVLLCAGESGERVDTFCEREFALPGQNPVMPTYLPTLTARAVTSDDSLTPFHLTAYRNPSNYSLTAGSGGAMTNSSSLQVLDGSSSARVQLKSCMTKVVNVKFPISGQVNALGEAEFDIETLDLVDVELAFPRGHAMDVYCHSQSVRLQGLGDPQTLVGERWSPTP